MKTPSTSKGNKECVVGNHTGEDRMGVLNDETTFLISDSKAVMPQNFLAGDSKLRVAVGRAFLVVLVLLLVLGIGWTSLPRPRSASTATAFDVAGQEALTVQQPSAKSMHPGGNRARSGRQQPSDERGTAGQGLSSGAQRSKATAKHVADEQKKKAREHTTTKAANAKTASASAANAKTPTRTATTAIATAITATTKAANAKTATAKEATTKTATRKTMTAKAANAKTATAKEPTTKTATRKTMTAKAANAKTATAKAATAKTGDAKTPTATTATATAITAIAKVATGKKANATTALARLPASRGGLPDPAGRSHTQPGGSAAASREVEVGIVKNSKEVVDESRKSLTAPGTKEEKCSMLQDLEDAKRKYADAMKTAGAKDGQAARFAYMFFLGGRERNMHVCAMGVVAGKVRELDEEERAKIMDRATGKTKEITSSSTARGPEEKALFDIVAAVGHSSEEGGGGAVDFLKNLRYTKGGIVTNTTNSENTGIPEKKDDQPLFDAVMEASSYEEDMGSSGILTLAQKVYAGFAVKLLFGFTLTQYQRYIVIDADIYPLQSVSHLFFLKKEYTMVAPVAYWLNGGSPVGNAQLWMGTPSKKTHEKLVKKVQRHDPSKFDMDILNDSFFSHDAFDCPGPPEGVLPPWYMMLDSDWHLTEHTEAATANPYTPKDDALIKEYIQKRPAAASYYGLTEMKGARNVRDVSTAPSDELDLAKKMLNVHYTGWGKKPWHQDLFKLKDFPQPFREQAVLPFLRQWNAICSVHLPTTTPTQEESEPMGNPLRSTSEPGAAESSSWLSRAVQPPRYSGSPSSGRWEHVVGVLPEQSFHLEDDESDDGESPAYSSSLRPTIPASSTSRTTDATDKSDIADELYQGAAWEEPTLADHHRLPPTAPQHENERALLNYVGMMLVVVFCSIVGMRYGRGALKRRSKAQRAAAEARKTGSKKTPREQTGVEATRQKVVQFLDESAKGPAAGLFDDPAVADDDQDEFMPVI